jgi:hypothetical protein
MNAIISLIRTIALSSGGKNVAWLAAYRRTADLARRQRDLGDVASEGHEATGEELVQLLRVERQQLTDWPSVSVNVQNNTHTHSL